MADDGMTLNDISGRSDNRLKAALADVTDRFIAANPNSHERAQKAAAVMPGGNTRTVLHYEPFPVAMVKGEGAYLIDMDGHRYTDFLGEYSAGLYGHSNEIIKNALKEAIDAGVVLGAPNRWEGLLAEQVCNRFASIDKVRFTNSGTEANLMAIGAARAFTGKDRIMVMESGYHGGVLYFPSGGVSALNAPFDIARAPFNDIEGSLAILKANRSELAAVLVEPLMGAGGSIPARRAYLDALRQFTREHGILLIFDEVMTSRSASGGLQQRMGVTPDMTTLGKYIGGGASFGAFGGSEAVMGQFDPGLGNPLRHAGTFNNNVMSMAAGYAGLSQVFTAERADELFDRGERLKADLNDCCAKHGAAVQMTGSGSVLGIHTSTNEILSPKDLNDSPDKLKLIHLEMMMRGFTYAQRGYISLCLPMTDGDCQGFVDAFADVLSTHGDIFAA